MGKQTLLSSELSRLRALTHAGLAATDVCTELRKWTYLQARPGRRQARRTIRLDRWQKNLAQTLRETAALGGPVGLLLGKVHPLIRREERLARKLSALEKQFAFQASLALVLPWAVAALSGGIQNNFFTLGGGVLQFMGLAVFCFVFHRMLRSSNVDLDFVFELLVATWMRVLAGNSTWVSVESALTMQSPNAPLHYWQRWLQSEQLTAKEGAAPFGWPDCLEKSKSAARLLESLLRSGAPAAEALSDFVHQLEEERQDDFEEKLGALPTKLSLAFCLFFAPAVFAIFLGALWPKLSTLSI